MVSIAGKEITKRGFHVLQTLVSVICIAAFLVALHLNFVIAVVPSESMLPTLEVNDFMLVRRSDTPRRGDVVVFYPYPDDQTRYVKRAVAVEGDTIAIQDGVVILNGEVLDEPYLADCKTVGEMPEYTVPDGCFFALGDNRQNSYDCRYIGPIPYEQFIGHMIFKF